MTGSKKQKIGMANSKESDHTAPFDKGFCCLSQYFDLFAIHLDFLSFYLEHKSVLQIRRGKQVILGIIFHITPLKHMLLPIIRTVSARRF